MSVSRIGMALAFWTDICALERYLAMLKAFRSNGKFRPTGPFRYLEFERMLLKGAEWDSEYVYRGERSSLRAMSLLPLSLFEWVQSSKRVFRVSRQTADELVHGGYTPPKCTWEKFPWPFDAFALSFEVPLHIHEDHDKSYDAVIVFRMIRDGRMALVFQWLPVMLGDYIPLSSGALADLLKDYGEEQRHEEAAILAKLPRRVRRALNLRKAEKSPQIRELQERVNKLADEEAADAERQIEMRQPLFAQFEAGTFHGIYGLTDQVSEAPQVSFLHSFCDLIAHGGSTVRVEGNGSKMFKPEQTKAEDLVAGASVFAVGSRSQLATGMRTVRQSNEPTGLTVRPHPRRGFYRRPPGSQPDALKTVWVDQTWIHEEEARAKGLLPVSETVVDVSGEG